MLKKQEAIALVNSYLSHFAQRERTNIRDSFAPNAILVLTEFQNELNDKSPELYNVVYPNLGFREDLNGFNSIKISNNNLASYVLIEKFINDVKKLQIETHLSALLHQFQKQALNPAFPKFKREMGRGQKDKLQAIFDGLQLLLDKYMNSVEDELIEKVEHLSLPLLFSTFFAEGATYAPIVIFMSTMNELLQKPTLYSHDLIQLKQPALLARKTLLQLPKIKEIDRFHWLINWVCDFINDHICEVFESHKIKNVNRFFVQLNETIKEAEQIENKSLEEFSMFSSSL